jgi:hypothetical protein
LIVRNSVGEKNRDLNRKAVFIYHIAPVAAPPIFFVLDVERKQYL